MGNIFLSSDLQAATKAEGWKSLKCVTPERELVKSYDPLKENKGKSTRKGTQRRLAQTGADRSRLEQNGRESNWPAQVIFFWFLSQTARS